MTFLPAAEREFFRLDRPVRHRIANALVNLSDDPRPAGVRAMAGSSGWLRIRVGDYRVVYEVHDGELRVLIVTVGHRSKVYRSL